MYFHMGKSRTQVVASLAILLAWCVCAFALDPSLDISQYAHSTWKIRDGFVKGEIISIAQTPDGYLWLGTMFGLVRFDGVRAVPWQPPSNQHLPPGAIRCLLVSRDGALWIGTWTGLARWKDGQLTRYPKLDGLIIFALVEGHDGTIWVGAGGSPKTGTLCAIRGVALDCAGGNGQFGAFVGALHEDPEGNLWAGVADGLWRWKPGPPKFFSLPGTSDGIAAIGDDADGALLIGWRGAIFRFVAGRVEPYLISGFSSRFFAGKIFRDSDGSLWVGTVEVGLIHIHHGKTDIFSRADGLSGDRTYAIFEDRERNVWVSTIDGLDRFRENAVATLTKKQGLSAALVESILSDRSGSVWIATNVGLNVLDHGSMTVPPTGSSNRDGKLGGSSPGSLFQDDRGRIWVSTARELGFLEDGRFTSISGVPGPMLSITQETAGDVWAINEPVGLIRISPNNVPKQIGWADLGHTDNATVLVADHKQGGLWIGFYKGGVSYFLDGQTRASYTAANGLGAGRVSDFFFDNEGALWISTEGGLSRLKDNRIATLTSKNGLPCDTVHWAIADNDGSMWLYTTCGLVRIARTELDAWAAVVDKDQNAPLRIHSTLFDLSDGVKSLSDPGHTHPQVTKTPNGKLWFNPWDGISVIDPHHLPFNKTPPPVHIEKITADDKSVDISNGMHLPTGVRNLDIDYTALSLVVPEKVRFRVKLEGQDKDWRELVNVRHVEYTNLPPKHYRFRVLACNNSGVWNEEGAALEFVIPPMWYQTNWFRAACVVLFFAMLWGIHELRVRQLAHEFNMGLEQRVAERTRIARELHDTLLQSFQAILPLLQAGINMFGSRPADALRTFEKAADHASQAIAEGRDAIQGMRMSTVEKNDLAVAIRTLGEELASAATNTPSPNFNVVVEGTSRNLHPILRDEVYRLATEALRNAFRHAAAQNVEVEIRYDEKYFRLRIRDDGKGIPSDVLSGDGREGHYGLPGMRERAKLVGGKLTIWTELDGGTEIELNIPGARAFVKSARPFWYFGKRSATETDEKEPIERE